MKINWKLRLQSKAFWVALFGIIGFAVVDSGLVDAGRAETYIELVMALLIGAGIIADPTTQGFSDSERAMKYDKPAGE